MRREFQKEGEVSGKPRLLGSIATAAGSYLLKQGYDIPTLCRQGKIFLEQNNRIETVN